MNTELIARLRKLSAENKSPRDAIDEAADALEAAQPKEPQGVKPMIKVKVLPTDFGIPPKYSGYAEDYANFKVSEAAQPAGEPVHEYVIELPDGDTRETKVWWSERKATGNGYSHHLSISVSETPSTVLAPQVPMTQPVKQAPPKGWMPDALRRAGFSEDEIKGVKP